MTVEITNAMRLASYRVMSRPRAEHEREIDQLDAAVAAALGEFNPWQPIENAPLDIPLLLGWWTEWPARVWKQEVSVAGMENTKPTGYSNGWRHGQATHYKHLSPPPKEGQ